MLTSLQVNDAENENKKMKQKNFEGKGPCSASPVLPSLPIYISQVINDFFSRKYKYNLLK